MIQSLSLLVHADSKVGKTTLAATAPAPRLILDAEGGTKFLPQRMCEWDPMQGGPPQMLGTGCDTCVVHVRDYDTMINVYQWLSFGQHDFNSVSLDSITEVQRRCKAKLAGLDTPDQRQWGQLLIHMETLIQSYRDLTLHPTKPLQVAVFIAETRETNGKWRPYMQGQLAVSLPYKMDLVGYMWVEQIAGPEGSPLVNERGEPLQKRRLLISPHPQYEAGERVQGRLPSVIDNPNIETMLQQIYGNTNGKEV